MNAREMFKKLGYKYNKYRDRNQMIEYRKENSTLVLFWIKERVFSVSEYCVLVGTTRYLYDIEFNDGAMFCVDREQIEFVTENE